MSKRSPDNILLYLTPDDEQQIRDLFSRLHARGFPAQRQRPHITVTFSPEMNTRTVAAASKLLPPLMPITFTRSGVIVFGTKRKQTVAWLLDTNETVEAAARDISATNPEGRGAKWIPHLTLGLRLPRELVPGYIHAVEEETSPHLKTLKADTAALWQPRLENRFIFTTN
ncbi:MAG: 2'-5' RNA ligase family protein [Corynebacterium sp.]|nr:2'-5' RNA ligase family protein [Corynebacterium sp.]